jgi:hypothetical protein
MLVRWAGRPLGTDCIGDPLGPLPFILAVFPFESHTPFSHPAGGLSDEVRVGRLKLGCEAWFGRSVESAAYGGIIWDSWMVTLIKEAVFPPGSCA